MKNIFVYNPNTFQVVGLSRTQRLLTASITQLIWFGMQLVPARARLI